MTPVQAHNRLKALVMEGSRISWEEPHARLRARERNVQVYIAERIVRAARFLRITYSAEGGERWRISGEDPDGRPVDIVVVERPLDVIRVVTVIRTDE